MRKTPLVNEEIYHIYNRGVDKRDIFSSINDLDRFVTSIKFFNTEKAIGSIYNKNLHKNKNEVSSQPLVEIISYDILPNHFHFILKQKLDKGISEFMKRLLGGYTNYFNKKQDRSGALFQGKFKSIHVDTQDYLNILIGYVNYNNLVHNIPKSREKFTRSSMLEIETGNFYLLDKTSTQEYILEHFKNVNLFKKHCKEVAGIIRNRRQDFMIPEGYLFNNKDI